MNMRESLLIKNFGPIREVEIDDIRPLTIFIGESGSGKSTIMKVLAMFRWIYKMMNIRSYLRFAGISKSPFRFSLSSYIANAGFDNYLKENSEIVYTKGSCTISLSRKKMNAKDLVPQEELSLEKISFISDKRNMIPDILASNTEKKTANFFLRETFEDFKEAAQKIKTFPIDYLGVQMAVEKAGNIDKYRIKQMGETKGFSINWEDASSGMQTVTPLSVIVEYFATQYDVTGALNRSVLKYLSGSDDLKKFRPNQNIGEIQNRCVNIHVEEPELSLYPESQKSLMDFLVHRCFQTAQSYSINLMMATHSPYIVNYLNLLTKRYEKTPSMPGIAFADVDVYEISDGENYSLKVENEQNLIDTRIMSDPISDIYTQFNEME